MKYAFVLCAILTCLLPSCFSSSNSTSPSSTHELLFKEGVINNPVLQQILEITKVPHNNTLESINKAIQGKRDEKDYEGWLRQGERWDAKNIYENEREQLLPKLAAIGYVDALYANKKLHNYVIVLGSLATNVRKRLAFLIEEYTKHGVRAEEIILLGSARSLNTKEETAEMLLNDQSILPFRSNWYFDGTLPTTEYEMMKFIVDQSEIPLDIRLRIRVLDTPMKPEGRPNTQDTIKTWLATNPEPGFVLAISHQPYVHYQNAVVRSMLPKGFRLETVGSAAKPNERMAMYLDSLAREIYQEHLDAQKK